jgi:hypothetical protein
LCNTAFQSNQHKDDDKDNSSSHYGVLLSVAYTYTDLYGYIDDSQTVPCIRKILDRSDMKTISIKMIPRKAGRSKEDY